MLHQPTSRCYYMPNEAETDRPCLGYIRGDRYSLMIDAGNSPAHHQLFLSELSAQDLPAPHAIAITHSHWDHTYGMCATSVPTLVNHMTQLHLQQMAQWVWTLPAMEERLRTGEDIRLCHDCILKEYPDLSAIRVVPGTVVYHGSMTIDLGGVHAQLIHLDNSHTDDCSIVYVPEEKIAFLSDITCDDLHHQPPCIHQARFKTLRRFLENLDFTHAIDGHWHQPVPKDAVLADMDENLATAELLLP